MSKTQDGSAEKHGHEVANDIPEDAPVGAAGSEWRVGLVASDPLRVLGMQSIVDGAELTIAGERRRATLTPMSLTELRGHPELSVVMIDGSGRDHLLEIVAALRRERPLLHVVVIGDSSSSESIERAIGAGAKGYLTHEAAEGEIRMALEIVGDGSIWAPRKVLARLLDRRAEGPRGGGMREISITDREMQVLRHLMAGRGNREIGAQLAIDESTVKAHVSRLMRKVGAKNRIELTMQALKHRFAKEPRG